MQWRVTCYFFNIITVYLLAGVSGIGTCLCISLLVHSHWCEVSVCNGLYCCRIVYFFIFLMDPYPLNENSFFNMAPSDVVVSPIPYQINEDESLNALLLSIQESARITKAWWRRAEVVTLSDVEGSSRVIVDPASERPTVMPDFETYQSLWGYVCSPLDFQWGEYFSMRFGSFMYLEYAIDTLEQQRDLYVGDVVTNGSMVFINFNEFIEKLRKLYWKDAEEVQQISTLLRDVGLGKE